MKNSSYLNYTYLYKLNYIRKFRKTYIESMSSTGAELFDFIPSSSMSSNCVSGIKMSIARSLSVFPTFRWTAWWTAWTVFITFTVNVVFKVNIAVQNSNGHFVFDCGVTNGSCQMSLKVGIIWLRLWPERIYNPLQQWDFQQCLPFSWTTLRDKHCRHPIAVMGVVDTFGHCAISALQI